MCCESAVAESEEELGGQFSRKQLENLGRYLRSCGVEVVAIPDESELDPRFSQTSAFIGKYLPYIKINKRSLFNFELFPREPGSFYGRLAKV